MKAFNNFQLNIFNTLCFMYKCKQNLSSPVFHNIFTHRKKIKYSLRNENSIQEPLYQTNFKKLTFSDSDSFQAFKRGLKQLLLLVELNHLEMLN